MNHRVFIFTCGALAQRRSSSCPFHHHHHLLLLLHLPKFQNEFLKALKVKFNMESYAIWVKNFKSEDRLSLRGHSEAKIADFNFTLKNPDGFLIFCQRVPMAKKSKSQKIPPPIAAAGLLGPDLVLHAHYAT